MNPIKEANSIFNNLDLVPGTVPRPLTHKSTTYYAFVNGEPRGGTSKPRSVTLRIGQVVVVWGYSVPVVVLGIGSTRPNNPEKWRVFVRLLTPTESQTVTVDYRHPNRKAASKVAAKQRPPIRMDIDSVIHIAEGQIIQQVADNFRGMVELCRSKNDPSSRGSFLTPASAPSSPVATEPALAPMPSRGLLTRRQSSGDTTPSLAARIAAEEEEDEEEDTSPAQTAFRQSSPWDSSRRPATVPVSLMAPDHEGWSPEPQDSSTDDESNIEKRNPISSIALPTRTGHSKANRARRASLHSSRGSPLSPEDVDLSGAEPNFFASVLRTLNETVSQTSRSAEESSVRIASAFGTVTERILENNTNNLKVLTNSFQETTRRIEDASRSQMEIFQSMLDVITKNHQETMRYLTKNGKRARSPDSNSEEEDEPTAKVPRRS